MFDAVYDFILSTNGYLVTGAVVSLLFIIFAEVYHHFHKEKVYFLHKCSLFCLGMYLTMLLSLTVSPIYGWSLNNLGHKINLIPFTVIKTMWQNPINFFGNIFAFLPFGFLLVLLCNYCRKAYITGLLGAGLSFVIEFLQLFEARGTDIDDILLNTLGTMIGYLLGILFLTIFEDLKRFVGVKRFIEGKILRKINDTKEILLFTCLILVSVLLVGGCKRYAFFHSYDHIAPTDENSSNNLSGDNQNSNGDITTSLSSDSKAKTPPALCEHPLDVALHSNSVYVLNITDNICLYDYNSTVKIAPASTTKLLTALTVLSYCDPDDVVTVGSEVRLIASDASRAWLNPGNVLTIRQLLTALLLPSGNDAAYALAVYTGRVIGNDSSLAVNDSIALFLHSMNQKAKEVGAVSSCFCSPDGYDTDGQYSTAYDLALIARSCLDNTTIRSIVSCARISDTWKSGEAVTYENTNELLLSDSAYYYKNAIGMKTGRSSKAGSCLISAAVMKDKTYLCVVMGSTEDGRFLDSLEIYEQID